MLAVVLAVIAAQTGIVALPGDGGGASTYPRDVRTIAGRARVWVAAHAAPRTALVLDIDETALASHTTGGALAPVRRVYRTARRHHVRVFFVTGRDEHRRAETVDALRAAGYPAWAGLSLEPEDSTRSVTAYKTGAREAVEARGYSIVANVGDQYSDLDGNHAQRAFKLPNPFYTIP